MSLLITGSIGIDTVKTPFGTAKECLGGSVVYCSMSASFFTPVRFLGVVGDDCPFDIHKTFEGKDVDLTGLEVRNGSKTFRWQGSYVDQMDQANTDMVELNVLAEAPPVLPESYIDSEYVFLANTNPSLQIAMIEKLSRPKLIVADTMNLWIETTRADLMEMLTKIDGLVLNEGEARMLTGNFNLISAGKDILEMGPDFVIIKKGEHGAILMTNDNEIFALPAYPTANVIDPTGAGDSFAGGVMGYVASKDKYDFETLKNAIVYGTCAASLAIEDFSLNRWQNASYDDIERRREQIRAMMNF